MGCPLLLMWSMVRLALAFTFNVLYDTLCVGLFFYCGSWYVNLWPTILMRCIVSYALSFTFSVLHVS